MTFLTCVACLGTCLALEISVPNDWQQAAAASPRAKDAATGVMAELNECKTIADNTSRLSCFDAATAKLAEAQANGDVRIIDREDIRATRRSLFGFPLPKVAFFKGDDTAVDTPTEIDTTIKSIGPAEYGKFTLIMEDGAVWRTAEPLPRDPRVGMPVHLKQGAFGNYFMRVGSMRPVAAQRVR